MAFVAEGSTCCADTAEFECSSCNHATQEPDVQVLLNGACNKWSAWRSAALGLLHGCVHANQPRFMEALLAQHQGAEKLAGTLTTKLASERCVITFAANLT
jgi:hypothetical protein